MSNNVGYAELNDIAKRDLKFSQDNYEKELPMPDNSRRWHVTVLLSKNGSEIKKNMRCIYCGMIVSQHQRAVQMVYEGIVTEEKRAIEVQCRRCKCVYHLV